MRIDRASRLIGAPISVVYRALTNRNAVERWLPPEGARGIVEAFDPQPGGAFRITLVFDTPGESGARKSSRMTDIVDGQFVDLVPEELVRQRFTFRSDDPAFAGLMTMTWRLTSKEGGTEVEVSAENVPAGISAHDHQLGMDSSLQNLANFVTERR